MSDMTTIDKGYKQRIGALGLSSQLLQNVPQIVDDFRAASNWQRGGDGLGVYLLFVNGLEIYLDKW